MRTLSRSLTALAAAALLLGACGTEAPLPGPSDRSDVAVNLPPTPDLTAKTYVKRNSDGSLTVEGALRDRDDYLSKTVTVRGKVAKLVLCPTPPPPPAPEVVDEDSPPPPPPKPPRTCDPPPHAYLQDVEPVSERQLLVYGTMDSPLADLIEGEVVNLTGAFTIISGDGVFINQAGLLVLPDKEPEPTDADATP